MAIHSPSSLLDLNNASPLDAALAYIERGWPVLPLRPNLKTPLTQHGLHDATLDPNIASRWWRTTPNANIGLRTGIAFDVLDIDGMAGSPAWTTLRNLSGDAYHHDGPVAATGKGYHLLVHPTGGRNSANRLPGLDFRGSNGYIVASPSRHPLGHRYQWLRDGTLRTAPEWMLMLVMPPPRSRSDSAIPAENLAPILEAFALWEPSHPLKPIGQNYITSCIFHDDSTPSMVLYPDTNSFYCFGCGEWGDSLNLTKYVQTGALR